MPKRLILINNSIEKVVVCEPKKSKKNQPLKTSKPESKAISPYNFNNIHKRFMVLYDISDMRLVWRKVRSHFKKENKIELPKRFVKYPKLWEMLNDWIEKKIKYFVDSGGKDIAYFNKSDLKDRGWDDKIILKLYPKPDKIVYLGRGRYAYYYNGTAIGELEDGDEFLEYITVKLERKRKRELYKINKERLISQKFGTEFIK